MMQRFVEQALSEFLKSTAQSFPVIEQKSWQIRIFHKSGGLKKQWNIQQDDNPIEKIKFEYNKHIIGSGSITFAYLDFPVDSGDIVELYYEGKLKYKALIDVTLDGKGGEAKLIPFSQRFQELYYNPNYSSKKIKEILEDVITNNQSDTSIVYVDVYIDEQNGFTFTKNYTGYETLKKIIDENVNNYDDREWGVTQHNIFKVYEPHTSIDQIFFNSDSPAYQDIKIKKDSRKVKATRYQVFRKTAGAGEVSRSGQVGYGSGYPTLDIENDIRKKVGKITVSELLSTDAEALDNAYSQLKAQAVIPEIIQVSEFQIDRYFPVIGDRIIIEDHPEYIRKIIINCDSLTNDDNSLSESGLWTGGIISTIEKVEGAGSIEFSSGSIKYNFSEPYRLKNAEKLGFMIKGDIDGAYITMVINETGWSSGAWGIGGWSLNRSGSKIEKVISIFTSGVWEFKQFDIDIDLIQSIEFKFNSVVSSTVYIDRIELYGLFKKRYEANIVQADIEIDKLGTKCNLTLNEYDVFANDEDFQNRLELERLKSISQNT